MGLPSLVGFLPWHAICRGLLMGLNPNWPPEHFQILALDGGGIRGLYTASLLASMERGLQGRLVDHFDLIAGTSTGGIIALGLALGKTPEELVSFYRNDGAQIFPRPTGLGARIRHLFRVKYRPKALENSLRREFAGKRLTECSRAVVIPTYNLDSDKPVVLKTPHNEEFREDPQVEVWKVALATSAAPTFLPASTEIRESRHVDGGVWANNPALVGVIEAHRFLGVPLHAIHVLSIGTGNVVKNRPGKLDWGGRWAWRGDGIDVLLRAQSEGVQNQVRLLLTDQQVLRINPTVPAAWDEMDVLRREFAALGQEDAKKHRTAITKRFLGHRGLNLQQLRAATGARN